jgi:hypothetical protein
MAVQYLGDNPSTAASRSARRHQPGQPLRRDPRRPAHLDRAGDLAALGVVLRLGRVEHRRDPAGTVQRADRARRLQDRLVRREGRLLRPWSLCGPTAPFIAAMEQSIPLVTGAGWDERLGPGDRQPVHQRRPRHDAPQGAGRQADVIVFLDYDLSWDPARPPEADRDAGRCRRRPLPLQEGRRRVHGRLETDAGRAPHRPARRRLHRGHARPGGLPEDHQGGRRPLHAGLSRALLRPPIAPPWTCSTTAPTRASGGARTTPFPAAGWPAAARSGSCPT